MSKLSLVQQSFLHIVACFLQQDRKDECLAAFRAVRDAGQEEQLFYLAASHKLSAAIFETLRLGVPDRELSEMAGYTGWKMTAIREVLAQSGRTESFLTLYKKFLQAEIKALVVKGLVCRSLYEKPDYRISADEDLLVKPEDAQKLDALLVSEGFERENFDFHRLPHEVGYRNHANGLYLEIHFTLFEQDSALFGRLNSYFAGAFEQAVLVPVGGCDVWSLDYTSHFLYLVFHSYKHFLYSGFGIRQVCDMVRMAEKWQVRIDWSYVHKVLRQLHMEQFYNGVMDIENAEHEELVCDILEAGVYGSSSKERVHSANITLAAAEGKNPLCTSLFPKRSYMEKQYPFVKKSVLFLPAAWGLRLVTYLTKRDVHGRAGESVSIAENRIRLLQKYGLLEDQVHQENV